MSRKAGPPIAKGYAWTLQLQLTSDDEVFPAGAEYRAQFRLKRTSVSAITEANTGNGGIVRVDGTQLEINLTAIQTDLMEAGSVSFDIVRTDVDPQIHLNFSVTVPVFQPITVP